MTIGEALKRERESLGLTQEEMTKNIIQKSHYSKIERNIEGISADSLFKILFAHQKLTSKARFNGREQVLMKVSLKWALFSQQ